MKKTFCAFVAVCVLVMLGGCVEAQKSQYYAGFDGVLDFGVYSGAAQIVDDEIEALKEEMKGGELAAYWYNMGSLGPDAKPEKVFFEYIEAMEGLGFDSSYDREQEKCVLAHLMNESFLISVGWYPREEEVFVLLGPAG